MPRSWQYRMTSDLTHRRNTRLGPGTLCGLSLGKADVLGTSQDSEHLFIDPLVS